MPPGMQMPEIPPDLPMFKASPMSAMPNAEFGNRSDILAADIPAGGKTTARAIARSTGTIRFTADMPPADDVIRDIVRHRMTEIDEHRSARRSRRAPFSPTFPPIRGRKGFQLRSTGRSPCGRQRPPRA